MDISLNIKPKQQCSTILDLDVPDTWLFPRVKFWQESKTTVEVKKWVTSQLLQGLTWLETTLEV